MASRLRSLCVFVLLCGAVCFADTPKKKGAQTSPSDTGGNAGQQPGLSYVRADWSDDLVLPADRRRVVLCYKLKAISPNSVQPLILEPTHSIELVCAGTTDPQGVEACRPTGTNSWNPCTTIDDRHPLLTRDKIVVAVSATDDAIQGLEVLNINVTTQQAAPINPAPVRPTITTTPSAAGGGTPATHIYYLTWPDRLYGDTVPTVTISGVYSPPGAIAATPAWSMTTGYSKGDTITANGHLFSATNDGTSGASPPAFPLAPGATVQDGAPNGVTWKESGPVTVPPTDQMVTLLNLALPQVHQLYYYNVTTGVAASTLKNPTFLRLQQTPPPNSPPSATPTYFTQKSNGDISVAPVMLFTAYIKAMDAESRWRLADLTPGVAFGFSLTSPSTSFYFGGSSEIRRNVQLVYGVNLAKVNALVTEGFVPPTSSAAPTTNQEFGTGAFVGLTINIDFIKGLFGGGGGSKQ